MNNYLSQIIATSQGTANVIQPRIASLFEPVAPSVSPIFSDDAATVESSSSPQPRSKEKHTAIADPTNAATEIAAQPIHIVRDTRLIVENNLEQSEPGSRSIAQPDVLEPQASIPTLSEPMIRQETIVQIAPVKPIESHRESVPMIEPALENESRAPMSWIVQPKIMRSEQARANDSSSAPIIRVTIGRIEVRANFVSPTPPPRVVPSTPKLSLDEYLKSQRRGER